MQKLSIFINYVRFVQSSKFLMASAVVAGISLFVITGVLRPQSVAAALPRDCDANSIINCGAVTKEEFVQKYNQNQPGDLKAVYEHFGLSQSEIERFQQTAKMGTVYKDGRVVVDGKVVGTHATSIGRHNKPSSTPLNIAGKTYYTRTNQTAFQSDAIQAHVMMNGDQAEFIALTSCGNPVTVTHPVQPTYRCDMLNREQIDRDTYKFSTKVTAKDGAKLTKVVYEFGDGQKVEKTNPTEVVTHTYQKTGDFTAKVTAYFEVNGKTQTHTTAECTKPVEIKPEAEKPTYKCTSLTARQITRNKYEFTANATVTGDAHLKDAKFDFDDGQTAEGIIPTESNKVVVEHEYAKEDSYTIVATLNFTVANGVKSDKCEVRITVSPETCPINPSVSKNSPECEPCPHNKDLSKNSPECKAPETPKNLPSTGPAEMISGALGFGSIMTAGSYYLRSRRDLLAVIFKR